MSLSAWDQRGVAVHILLFDIALGLCASGAAVAVAELSASCPTLGWLALASFFYGARHAAKQGDVPTTVAFSLFAPVWAVARVFPPPTAAVVVSLVAMAAACAYRYRVKYFDRLFVRFARFAAHLNKNEPTHIAIDSWTFSDKPD